MKEIFNYFLRKKEPGKNTSLKWMYRFNTIAIVVFLIGVVYYIVKRIN